MQEKNDAMQDEIAKRQNTREYFYEQGRNEEFERILKLLDNEADNTLMLTTGWNEDDVTYHFVYGDALRAALARK